MSKVLKVVLVVAVVAAIVIFAAPAIPGLLASLSVGAAAAAAITSVIVGTAIGIGLSAIGSLFRKSPTLSPASTDRLNSTINPTATRKIVFGKTAAGNDIRFFETYGSKKDRYSQVVALASHKINAVLSFHTEEKLGWSGGSISNQSILSYRPVLVGTSTNGMTVGSGSFWNSTCTFTGCAYAAIDWTLDAKISPQGVPSRTTTIVEGCPVYDPRRDGSRGGVGAHRADNNATWTYREGGVEIGRNPALALLTYIIGWRVNNKLMWGMGIPLSRVNLDNFRVYANLCEEGVILQGGGTVQRYTCDQIFQTSDTHESVISAITACMGSCKMSDVGGRYCLIGGYDDTASPKQFFSEDDLIGQPGSPVPYNWVPATSIAETHNIARGRFTSPGDLYQLVDWGSIETTPLPDGIDRTMTLDFGGVTRAETCQRIAKQFLLREALTPGMLVGTFGPRAFAVEVGSLVELSIAAQGWNRKLFRVMEMSETHDLFFQLTLREENPLVYAWDREEKPLPATIRPTGYDPADTITPQSLTLASTAVAGTNGVTISQITVNWTPETSGRVGSIQIESRLTGGKWNPQAANADPTTGSLVFSSNAPGVTVEVQARFRMTSGVYSPWVNASIVSQGITTVDTTARADANTAVTAVTGPSGIISSSSLQNQINNIMTNGVGNNDTTPPAVPTGLVIDSALTPTAAELIMSWTASPATDLARYDVEIKRGTGNYVPFATTSSPTLTVPAERNTLYTVRLRAVDKSGNASGFTTPATYTTTGDTTAPAAPSGLTVKAAPETAFVDLTAPADADLLFVKVMLNNASGTNIAVKDITAAPGAKISAIFSNLTKGTSYSITARAYDTSGNFSPTIGPQAFATTAGVDLNDLSPGLVTPRTVTTLPAAAGYTGTPLVFNQADGKLYRYSGGAWTASVNGSDVTPGTLTRDAIATGTLTAAQIATDALTARVLAIGNPDNIIPDGDFREQGFWDGNSAVASGLATGTFTSRVQVRDQNGQWPFKRTISYLASAEVLDVLTPFWDVEIGASYKVSYSIYTSPDFNGWINPTLHMPGVIWSSIRNSGAGTTPDSGEVAAGAFVGPNNVYGIGASPVSYVTTIPQQVNNATRQMQLRVVGSWTVGYVEFMIKMVRVSDSTLIKNGAIQTQHITVGELDGDRIRTNSMDANVIKANSVLASSVTVAGSGKTLAAIASDAAAGAAGGGDPAVRINTGVTQIDPGKISVGDGATLNNWRAGGNTSLINGGAMSANTIDANKLKIGLRAVSIIGIEFVWSPGVLSWNDGYVLWTDDNGGQQSSYIPAGSYGWQGGSFNYIYWAKGAGGLSIGVDNWQGLRSGDSIIMCSWSFNTPKFVANYGGTIIDNDKLKTDAVDARVINVGSLDAVSATIGTLSSAPSGQRVVITDGLISVYGSNNVLRVRLGIF